MNHATTIRPNDAVKRVNLMVILGAMFDLSDNDRGEHLLLGGTLMFHLLAITALLKRNEAADTEYNEHISRLQANAKRAPSTLYGQRLVDDAVDAMHEGVYHDAAGSMAAVGMLAPLMESMLAHLFQEISAKLSRPGGGRRSRLPDSAYWNPRCYAASKVEDDRQDIVLGFKQLSKDTGLEPFLPNSTHSILAALFGYRNKMFHNGFEWPIGVRDAFAKTVAKEGWNDWFSCATTGDQPWIFYMTPKFIRLCLSLIHQLVPAAGKFDRMLDQRSTS